MIKEKTVPNNTLATKAGMEKEICLNGGKEISSPITGDVNKDTFIRLCIFADNFILVLSSMIKLQNYE